MWWPSENNSFFLLHFGKISLLLQKKQQKGQLNLYYKTIQNGEEH